MASSSKESSNIPKKLSSPCANSSSDDDDNNPLNCASKAFDPLLALYSNEKSRKNNYKHYDNLALFESALKKSGIELVGSRKHRSTKTSESAVSKKEISFNHNERRFLPHQMPVQGTSAIKQKHNRNMLKYMHEVKGPLGVLKSKFIDNNQRIYVYTRKERGIRGLITGRLVAFDKHWNLLIENVCETWHRRKYSFSENSNVNITAEDCSERLRKLKITLPETKVKSLSRKYAEITRFYKQIMIRGEQVVLVSEKHQV